MCRRKCTASSREMPRAAVSVLDSVQVRVTILLVLSSLTSLQVRAATSISLSIQRTPVANRCIGRRTFVERSLWSVRREKLAQSLSGTSRAFFLGPIPRLAALMDSLNHLSRE